MSQYKKYCQKPNDFLALTGYTHTEFVALLPQFEKSFQARMETHRLDGHPRGNRKYSDYKNSPLPTIEEKLFFILVYLKSNNLQTIQGALFGISQPKANVWIHTLEAVLNDALQTLECCPSSSLTETVFKDEEGEIYFHDGTERPIERPRSPQAQKTYYSGKKKDMGSKISC